MTRPGTKGFTTSAKTVQEWKNLGFRDEQIRNFSEIGLVISPGLKIGTGYYLDDFQESVLLEALALFAETNEDHPSLTQEVNCASELFSALQNDTFVLLTTTAPEES